MIKVHDARKRSTNRVNTPSDKQPVQQNKTYLPPTGGLVTNTPLAAQSDNTAHVLENFFPTATSIEPRGGTILINDLSVSVKSLLDWSDGSIERFFACTDNNIYEFNSTTQSIDDISAAVHTGMTSGDYSSTIVRNDAGTFLLIVNSEDVGLYFDGTTWQQLHVSTQDFSFVWTYSNRVYFIKKGTLDVYYLDVNAITGVPTQLPLGGIFNQGGSLLFGATFSSDAGDGMDDRIVFVTDVGQVAIYTGTNPSDADNWSKQGVYSIGKPLGKKAFINVGGDVVVATAQGLVPLSGAIQKDVEELKLVAISRPIEPDWNRSVVISGDNLNWLAVKWEDKNMALIVPPDTDYCWVVNLETKSWTKFTGWPVLEMQVLGGALYYGMNTGNIVKCESGGYDLGMPFQCRVCYAFDHFGAAGRIKNAGIMKQTWRYANAFNSLFSVACDYQTSFASAPNAASQDNINDALWDVAKWDVTDWGSEADTYQIKQEWNSVTQQGYVLAPQIQITSAQSTKLQCQLISLDFTFSTGEVIV